MKQAIQALCAGVDKEEVQDFLARMDDEYFATFSPEDISTHIRMSGSLDPKHPVQLRVSPRPNGEFDIVIVGFDYLSEFSIFCGLISAFGLDIRSGDIYSFARNAPTPAIEAGSPVSKAKRSTIRKTIRPLPRKIVNVFRAGLKSGATFDDAKQREFEKELQTLAQLLGEGSSDLARERLNRFLIERIERMNEPLSGLLSPIEIVFDNQSSPVWTVMQARSEDAFAFLYSISNALAMRGIYIHKVKIRSVGPEAMDQFFIADRSGRKIEASEEQGRLQMAVAMIKQFTRFLPEAPDPAKAMRHFDQFLDKVDAIAEEEFPDRIVSFLAGSEGMNLLAHLLGSSDFLWDDFLSIHFADLLPVLERVTDTQIQSGPRNRDALRAALRESLALASSFQEKKSALNRFKDNQVFLIDAKHLLEPQTALTDFSQALTDLAEVVVDEAARLCYDHLVQGNGGRQKIASSRFAICGLGKFGGREMGYASDIELLFVHDESDGQAAQASTPATPFFESLARHVVDFIEAPRKGIFRIDVRLRPYGDAGALSVPLDRFANYYSTNGPAAPFERQALIKLRAIAGDATLGRAVETLRDDFSYSGAPWDSENALHLRRRQTRELVRPGKVNVKYGSGGIVDIEYATQYLQILHGHSHPELRVTNTLEALDQLHSLNIIGDREYSVLHEGYLFLRRLIDALRIVRGDASDLELPEETSEEFKSLARRLGYREQDRSKGAARLDKDIREWMKKIGEHFMNRFAPDEFSGVDRPRSK